MSTALYRRYRPETFADVIGQEHVTEPLITALENDRVNHAYLFSGPRGCGKTTSARILARCLNCAQGPTATPCGVCDSCRELSRDGGGSLDVIEMDAASHGGVDHARDLRERATFAPVRDRYKIFIIDEAHMVTREGFNALLKIVEEPPEHIKFIFATTEPNKVLGTIRSRTHHYPFRLVPPEVLTSYLQKLCAEEGVQVEGGVLPLVVRAGGGSVRDSLSILDQLIAGSEQGEIGYDLAVNLLGFTHGELLDEVVGAFASGNSAEVFASVDRVIQTGQDPRRFVEDLLERFRDLIIVQAVPDSARAILRTVSPEQLSHLNEQAQAFGAAELSRAADITNTALNEMSGATSPQLHLELLCARILLPAADKATGGIGARVDRIERRLAHGKTTPATPVHSQGATPPPPHQNSDSARGRQVESLPASGDPPGQGEAPLAHLRYRQQDQGKRAKEVQQPQQPQPAQSPSPAQAGMLQGQNTVLMVRNAWSDVIQRVQSPPARTWFSDCEPSKFENGALYIRSDIGTLRRVKDYIPQLKTALGQVLQLHVDIHAEVAKPAPVISNNRDLPSVAEATEQNSRQNTDTNKAPIAGGPRGGQQAWQKHGQPHTNQAPQWSTEDWNNPVTDWAVAQIPSEEPGETADTQPVSSSPEPGVSDTQGMGATSVAKEPTAATASEPAPETAPQLRVIQGDVPEHRDPTDQARENHPSSGMWQRPNVVAAPTPQPAQTGPSQNSSQQSAPEEAHKAQSPQKPEQPQTKPAPNTPEVSGFRQRFAAQLEAGHRASEQAAQQVTQGQAEETETEEFTPSDDDESLESSVLIGQRAVEKVLGGVVIDEKFHNQ